MCFNVSTEDIDSADTTLSGSVFQVHGIAAEKLHTNRCSFTVVTNSWLMMNDLSYGDTVKHQFGESCRLEVQCLYH